MGYLSPASTGRGTTIKVPVAVAMRFLSILRQSELKSVSKNRNVSRALQTQAQKLLEKKA